jgi:primosomal protein N'
MSTISPTCYNAPMKILTVIPIAKGIPRDELSYFSAKPVALGTLVTVPFGKRSIKGVVADQHEVRDLKSSIKSSDFALRNITSVHPEALPQGIFSAAQNTARFFAQSVGPVLETIVPHQVFDYYLSNPIPGSKPNPLRSDIQALQIPYFERLSYYRTLIRENLGKHVSTMIIVPTVIQAEKIFAEMKTGIEDSIMVAHSKKTKKQLEKTITHVITKKDPVVLIATAPFSTLIRNDWDTIIIEAAAASSYRYEFNPIFDLHFFVEEMAKSFRTRLIYADTYLGAPIRNRIITREITEARSTWHIAKPERFAVLDMKIKPFTVLHTDTYTLLNEALSHNENSVLLTTRKGLAPLTTCSDCGKTVTCPRCETPLVLHRKKTKDTPDQKRIYLCHHCLLTTDPLDTCTGCGSWKLATLGISTEGIQDELKTNLPRIKTFICDGDTATTPVQIQKILKAWQEHPGGILIATPMIIPYLDRTPFGIIASMDSLLSIPAYTSGETALGTALSFLEKISRGATLQTRNLAHDTIQAISSENLFDFAKNELESRTLFGYPPAKILLKVSIETDVDDAKGAVSYLEKIFAIHEPDLLMKKSRTANKVIVRAIMKIERILWLDFENDLHHTLRGLGREWKKEVNPDTVL